MVIGVCTLRLAIPGSHSLKEKRRALRSVHDGLRQRFNVSAAEVAEQDIWQRAVVGIACVSNEQRFCDAVLSKALAWVDGNHRVEVMHVEMEFL